MLVWGRRRGKREEYVEDAVNARQLHHAEDKESEHGAGAVFWAEDEQHTFQSRGSAASGVSGRWRKNVLFGLCLQDAKTGDGVHGLVVAVVEDEPAWGLGEVGTCEGEDGGKDDLDNVRDTPANGRGEVDRGVAGKVAAADAKGAQELADGDDAAALDAGGNLGVVTLGGIRWGGGKVDKDETDT